MPAETWFLTPFRRVVQLGSHGRFLESLRLGRYLPFDTLTEAMVGCLQHGPLDWETLRAQVRVRIPNDVDEGQLRLRHRKLGAVALLHETRAAAMDPFAIMANSTPRSPRIEFVEVTNHCGLSCITCPVGLGQMSRPRGFIDPELFAQIVSYAASLPTPDRLILHNAGEPLLHPALVSLVEMAARAGLRPEISTNAGLLNLGLYQALRDAGLARLIVALDGLDAVTLEAIRGKSARAACAMKNLEEILQERRRNGDRSPTVVVQMLRLAANRFQHEEFLARFGGLRDLGVLAFLRPLEADTDPRVFVSGERPCQRFCRSPWASVGVLWDGRVTACCMDWNGRTILGDLRRQSMAEVWLGRPLAELRQRLRDNHSLATDACYDCSYRADRFVPPALQDTFEEPCL